MIETPEESSRKETDNMLWNDRVSKRRPDKDEATAQEPSADLEDKVPLMASAMDDMLRNINTQDQDLSTKYSPQQENNRMSFQQHVLYSSFSPASHPTLLFVTR